MHRMIKLIISSLKSKKTGDSSQVINNPAQKETTPKKVIKTLLSFIVTFFLVFSFKAYLTFMATQDKGWIEANIPYPVKTEWVLDNIMRGIRFRTSFGNDGGFIANRLQEIHYKIYLSAKSKIPENDPFWISFWDPATDIPMQEYNDILRDEIIKNLSLIESSKSKVEDFNDFQRYYYQSSILTRIKFDIHYDNNDNELNLYIQSLKKMTSSISGIITSNFNFSSNSRTERFRGIPSYFFGSALITYMRSIELDKQQTCNISLRENIFFKIGDFLLDDRDKNNFFSKEELKSLRLSYKGMLRVFYKLHNEAHCNN